MANPETKIISTLSDAKLKQLADAREKALESRRRTLRDKLTRKVAELNVILGKDMSLPTVERVAKTLMDHEERWRTKHSAVVDAFNTALTGFREDIQELRKAIRHGHKPAATSNNPHKRASLSSGASHVSLRTLGSHHVRSVSPSARSLSPPSRSELAVSVASQRR